MRSSKRDLLLVPRRGKVNPRRKYYRLQRALNAAVAEVMTSGACIIYDSTNGRDVATVFYRSPREVSIIFLIKGHKLSNLWRR